ncbi:MAG: T9SS type A sorting domain-containing protein, partial [Paramuribaculum sp.]|nr:T9SS type A sorting domain-containing protein [Paramuribaculum sp.]
LHYDKAAQTITILNSAEPLSVSVYNAAGALLLVKGTLRQGEPLSVSPLPQGLNIVVATGSTATHTLKFIK